MYGNVLPNVASVEFTKALTDERRQQRQAESSGEAPALSVMRPFQVSPMSRKQFPRNETDRDKEARKGPRRAFPRTYKYCFEGFGLHSFIHSKPGMLGGANDARRILSAMADHPRRTLFTSVVAPTAMSLPQFQAALQRLPSIKTDSAPIL